MPTYRIPAHLMALCRNDSQRAVWLAQLPAAIGELETRWSLTLQPPLEENASCSWVAPCTRPDGSQAVLKIGMPHMEAEGEADGLRYWNGDPSVFLLAADPDLNGLLLERCVPGTSLHTLPEPEQDRVVAGLLKRLWRRRDQPHHMRPLARMITDWNQETADALDRLPDPGLAQAGMQMRQELAGNPALEVTLATDLHAGNILRAQREEWLVIDPKPFYGDQAYDATQHLLNCQDRLATDPQGTVTRFADLLEVDSRRVQQWLFARLAAESSGDGQALARVIEVF